MALIKSSIGALMGGTANFKPLFNKFISCWLNSCEKRFLTKPSINFGSIISLLNFGFCSLSLLNFLFRIFILSTVL